MTETQMTAREIISSLSVSDEDSRREMGAEEKMIARQIKAESRPQRFLDQLSTEELWDA